MNLIHIITILSLLIILGAFFYFLSQTYKMKVCNKIIFKANNEEDLLEAMENTEVSTALNEYKKSIKIATDNGLKTNIPANEYFNEDSMSKLFHWNMRMIDVASSTLVGLGLFGTFLGLTFGISGFDSSNADNIQRSIQSLLSGMGTAFLTSLLGMGLSLVYTFIEKKWKNSLTNSLYNLTEKFDNSYYIDDLDLLNLNQRVLFNGLKQDIMLSMNQHFTYVGAEGDRIEMANAIREILSENMEQSKALKSFSTDLALELNNGFDELLSRKMQERLLPLMENIDNTTKEVIEHIDKMAENVSSPAADMIQTVVDELKKSMTAIMNEFKNNLSGDATNELEELAKMLGKASQSMADFPKDMENISSTLQVTIEEVKKAISEISNSSATSNNAAMEKMQEQISFATATMSNAIEDVKDVMAGITQSSEQSNKDMISKLALASEQMSEFLNNTVGQLSVSVKDSIQGITDDVASKQSSLLALQENTVGETNKLLSTFNIGLDKMERMNEYISGTMNMFQKAQSEITGSTSQLNSISGDMKVATEVFNSAQNDYTTNVTDLQQQSQKNIDVITGLIKNSTDMSNDYVEKFETIRAGLVSIFNQIQTGLNEYSKTVQGSTQKYLDQYSTSLTTTTDALSSTMERQMEIAEMLSDTISKNRS